MYRNIDPMFGEQRGELKPMAADDHDEPVDYGEVVGRDFLDKLLLAIIDGHPEPSSSLARDNERRAARLRDARRALVTRVRGKGRAKISDDVILRWMGEQLYKGLARQTSAKIKGEPKSGVRSDREITQAALDQFELPESRAESIREKFGKQRSKWLDVAMYHDDVPEALDFSLLEQIKTILEKRDIKMDLKRIER